ncbi:uncharacterized protein EI97DRAFT_413599 [Westerdykella ornata]|uniref:BTB domain-containing protein n=1 Tax=Westerdykella ornata TaxID=318751 RepID=A0A6A6JQF3_WESOR|nr:uncharacterized protein EI97DRAFT_413599 [Westerdykella ornata]KAF2278772.1 hypothetical protein EI97DRAFT_413599 [Westerdykella ornata]
MADNNKPFEDNPLYNSPTLSDVTVRQISGGKSKDYKLHKAILASQSKWFYNAFCGNFKEASDQVVEVHDDKPHHFEMLLKCIYSRDYIPGKGYISHDACDDIIGTYIVADKYGCDDIIKSLPQALRQHIEWLSGYLVPGIVEDFYSHCGNTAKTEMGKVLAERVLSQRADRSAMDTIKECKNVCNDHPDFARDVILCLISRKTNLELRPKAGGDDSSAGRVGALRF